MADRPAPAGRPRHAVAVQRAGVGLSAADQSVPATHVPRDSLAAGAMNGTARKTHLDNRTTSSRSAFHTIPKDQMFLNFQKQPRKCKNYIISKGPLDCRKLSVTEQNRFGGCGQAAAAFAAGGITAGCQPMR